MRRKTSKVSDTGMCFLLVEPKSMSNSGEMARRIARHKDVREVHLTSGRYGMVVAAKAGPKGIGAISSAVQRATKSKPVKVAVSHLVYR